VGVLEGIPKGKKSKVARKNKQTNNVSNSPEQDTSTKDDSELKDSKENMETHETTTDPEKIQETIKKGGSTKNRK